MASGFWDKDGILLAEYLKKGATMTASYNTSHLDKVKQTLDSKRQGNPSKGVLLLTSPVTQQKLADLHCEVLKHIASSPDLAPSD
jgi:hypothetical protein